jgi:hypothetical protein
MDRCVFFFLLGSSSGIAFKVRSGDSIGALERAWLLLGSCHCDAAWGFGRRGRNA